MTKQPISKCLFKRNENINTSTQRPLWNVRSSLIHSSKLETFQMSINEGQIVVCLYNVKLLNNKKGANHQNS
jgi:hypothetical protein